MRIKAMRGYFGIGIENIKTGFNYGTLFRSANIFGASFIFVIGKRFKKQHSDTLCSERHLPLFEYDSFEEFYSNIPHGCELVGVELIDNAIPIANFKHPARACYLLGAEDYGLSKKAVDACKDIIVLPGERSLNVSVAGSIVMYDRIIKGIRVAQ
jgi:tRNA G18 (ribose-2'-O)-methylase SpoU